MIVGLKHNKSIKLTGAPCKVIDQSQPEAFLCTRFVPEAWSAKPTEVP